MDSAEYVYKLFRPLLVFVATIIIRYFALPICRKTKNFGKTAHKIFLLFALITNIIVTAMLVLGGAAVGFIKLGDPAIKISEVASSLDADRIIMGKKGLGNTESEIGHVSNKLLKLTSKPVHFLK